MITEFSGVVQKVLKQESSIVKKLKNSLWFIVIVALMAGCSSPRKARLAAGNDPQGAVSEVSQAMVAAQKDQLDVLADEQYAKGNLYLAESKRELKLGEPSEVVLEKAAIAKAFFEDAGKTAAPRRPLASRILKARKYAVLAGVRKSDKLVVSLLEIDENLKSETKQFSSSLSPDDYANLQKKYLVLEGKAVQFSKLNSADVTIKQSIDKSAEDLAPKSLNEAILDYKTAMNMIAQSPRSPSIYRRSLKGALDSATLLFDVMNIIKEAEGTPERIAVQIVKQKRALGELSSNVGKLEENLKSTQQSLDEKEGALKSTEDNLRSTKENLSSTQRNLQTTQQNLDSTKQNLDSTKQNLQSTKQSLEQKEGALKRTKGVLKSQEKQLASASMQVRFQQAMDEARSVLSEDDALVYQQGKKLVFRLKRVNFKSGTAVIPEASKQLISRVDSIIKKLDAEKVIVQGHSDSVGSAAGNKKLSKNRAAAVARYLSSLRGGYKLMYAGYGESHPIASNDSPEGRATNRRVDLVLSVKQ